MKYVYTNLAFALDLVKKHLKEGRYNLINVKRVPLPLEHYHQIKAGGTCKFQGTQKIG